MNKLLYLDLGFCFVGIIIGIYAACISNNISASIWALTSSFWALNSAVKQFNIIIIAKNKS